MHFSLSGGLSGNFDQWKLNAEWRMFKWLLRLTCKGKGVKFSVHDGAMLPFGAFPIKLICDDLLLFWKVFMALSWAETQPRWSFCGAVTCLLMANCCQHTALNKPLNSAINSALTLTKSIHLNLCPHVQHRNPKAHKKQTWKRQRAQASRLSLSLAWDTDAGSLVPMIHRRSNNTVYRYW